MIDILNYTEDDPKYRENRIETSDEIEILINQIKTLFQTPKGSILGLYGVGQNLEDLIYTMEYSEAAIQTEINNQITTWIPLARKYKVEISVRFFKGEVRDIGVIDILINSNPVVGFIVK